MEVLVLEFEGGTSDHYKAVNELLGVDMFTGEGEWPPGLVSHTAGVTARGDLTVVEVWESVAEQEEFMRSRLGPALAQAEVPKPSRVEWLKTLGHHRPKG